MSRKDFVFQQTTDDRTRNVPQGYLDGRAEHAIAPRLFAQLLNAGPTVVELESTTEQGYGPHGIETRYTHAYRLTRCNTQLVTLPKLVRRKKRKPAPPKPWHARAAAWIASEWQAASAEVDALRGAQ